MRFRDMPQVGTAILRRYPYWRPLGRGRIHRLVRELVNLRAWHHVQFQGWRPWEHS